MLLKKLLLQLPFSDKKRYNLVYDDFDDLKFGTINMCNLLKKDFFVFQIFAKDPLNDLMKQCSDCVIEVKNFVYYIVQDVDICERLNFAEIRFLCVYAIMGSLDSSDLRSMIESNAFSLEFDNYLEHTQILIDFSKYDSGILSKLNLR